VTPLLIIVAIGFLAWRYRKVLGLNKMWDQHGRAQAQDLAAQLGWSRQQQRTEKRDAAGRSSISSASPRRSFVPQLDSRRLPAALAVGAVVAVMGLGLELGGHSLLASLVFLFVGPFAGGLYVRSRWWVLIAAALAVMVGAGGRVGGVLVGLAVAAIAYGATRMDAKAWLARWNAES
jgi:hypothetical protein